MQSSELKERFFVDRTSSSRRGGFVSLQREKGISGFSDMQHTYFFQ